MSGLEQRCQQFHETALGTGKSKGTAKEITTLRRFLHKNQNSRFTDRAVAKLFDTIQIYSTNHTNQEEELRSGLLEDALKMPYTVFATKHKTKMLKWLENLRGVDGKNHEGIQNTAQRTLSLIDLKDDHQTATLMDDETGETFDEVKLPPGDLGHKIQDAFRTTDGILQVQTTVDDASSGMAIIGYHVT